MLWKIVTLFIVEQDRSGFIFVALPLKIHESYKTLPPQLNTATLSNMNSGNSETPLAFVHQELWIRVSPPVWSKLKHLAHYWMNCYSISTFMVSGG